jgi:hypothetical protein
MQEPKDMREKNIKPEIYREVKSQIMDGMWWIINKNYQQELGCDLSAWWRNHS